MQNDECKTINIKISSIRLNRKRRNFESQQLKDLAEQIIMRGALEPLHVKKSGAAYELLFGEKQLAAAKLAGIAFVPCKIITADDMQAELMQFAECISNSELNFFQEAEFYRRFMEKYGLTQAELAKRTGKSQSCIANKLRLLKLSRTEREEIIRCGLTGRHARALLKLPDTGVRLKAANEINRHSMNVAEAEEYIEKIIYSNSQNSNLKKLHCFIGKIKCMLDEIKQLGFYTEFENSDKTIIFKILN